ncbi:MAG TPA: nuclear transport factor 2 family protein [Mycobacteriales bacterium]|nr:nuclear transport factor 2 family protein [Mycobacteriales bacterium]
MATVTERLLEAMNAHDAERFAACFAEDYRSEQPAHPARAFSGREQVRQNWRAVFSGVPDLAATVLAWAPGPGTELSEWQWSGTHVDGSPFEMRGAMVLGVEDGQVRWGRLYMEPVEREGADIDRMVQETYRPPS